ncbi:MAG TPA: aspartate kinase [Bdellovibrionales bacterium]|nr:aspartate kinase [Bdellovibrionales bacterium]
MARSLIVQKYGGSSLAKPEQITAVAKKVADLHREGHAVLLVVSAMGKTTDQLVELAYKVSPTPNRRELDMLLTTGERVSMSLMSMALNDLGVHAISFTGSQAGVFTDDLHSNARIVDLKPTRVEAELAAGGVVVLAGFQGVSPKTKEITTLGRGGSDTTAVAMAAHFKAERCEIRKDVDGVHSADPNVVKETKHLARLHYDALLDMTYWGAKVLHYRSVELAKILDIPMMIALAHGDGRNTVIDGEAEMFEQAKIISVNSHKDARWLNVKAKDYASAFSALSNELKKNGLPLPQILDSGKTGDQFSFLATAPLETLNAIAQMCKTTTTLICANETLSTVTATCHGGFASPLPQEIAEKLAQAGVSVHKMIFGAMSITAVVDSNQRDLALRSIHP